MASLQKMIFIALIFAIAAPMSMGRREKSEKEHHHHKRDKSASGEKSDIESYLRDLCSETYESKECWKIIKPELSRFSDNDSWSVAGVVIDLAIAKADEINKELDQYYHDSSDESLKDKYLSCSKNYNDASRNLVVAKGNLDSDDYGYIPVQIDDTEEELQNCKHEFDENSFDPAHIRNRNKEFGHYLDIVRVAADHLVREGYID